MEPTIPCHECGAARVIVTRIRQMLRIDGRRRLHAATECPSCGHKDWSRDKMALAMSRVADAAATGGGEDGG